jgi:hypothetical protein
MIQPVLPSSPWKMGAASADEALSGINAAELLSAKWI